MHELAKIFLIASVLTATAFARAQSFHVVANVLAPDGSRELLWPREIFAFWSDGNSLPARDDRGFTLLGRGPWGTCYTVARFWDHLLIGNGLTLQALDVSRPDSPRVASELYLETVVQDVQIAGSYAFVATSIGFLVVDIAEPTHIAEVARITLAGIPARVELSTSLAFVLSAFGGLTVIDIANPRNPFVRNAIGTGGNSNVCLAVKDRIVYTGHLYSFDLEILDATNPDSVRRYVVPINAPALNAFVMDTLLFVTLWPVNSLLRVFSISQPLAPRMLGQVQVGSRTFALCRRDDFLFAATPDSGVATIDISDLTSPRVVTRTSRPVPIGMGGLDLAANDSLVFLAHYAGVWITRPLGNILSEVGYLHTGTRPDRIAVDGNRLYVPYLEAGLAIFDVTTPASPALLGFAEFNNGAGDVALFDHFAFCASSGSPADTNTGLWVVDIANPNNPRIAAHLYVPGGGHRLVFNDEKVFLIRSDSGCVIVDVADPLHPRTLGKYRTQGAVYGIAVKDNYIYLAVRDSGLVIVDASVPSDPIRVGKMLNHALGVCVKDSSAYVAHDSGLAIIDISRPRNPRMIGATRTSGSRSIVDVSVGDRYAYLAYDGLHVVDVSEPYYPTEVAVYGTSLFTVAVRMDTLFTTSSIGFIILKHNRLVSVKEEGKAGGLSGFSLAQNYPNPFNSETTIVFSVPKKDHVRLELFTLLGQRVLTLWEGTAETGEYKVNVHSASLSSGVYLYRYSSSAGSLARKMIVVR